MSSKELKTLLGGTRSITVCKKFLITGGAGFIAIDQATQIYHYSNKGKCSWYEFAKEIFNLSNIKCEINPITTNQYPTPAQRPINTLMNKDKIAETYGANIPNWIKSLNNCIEMLKRS